MKTPSRTNIMENTSRYIVLKLLKTKSKEQILKELLEKRNLTSGKNNMNDFQFCRPHEL
jgi:hypothetical protein